MSRFRMCNLVVILAISLFFLLPATALAEEPTTGTISGQVINETEDGGSVAGVEVTLITYVDGDIDEDKTEETITDGEGIFKFAGVDTGNQYLASAKYMDVDYYYLATFEDGETTADVEVYVFDTTDSDESIRVEQAYIIISYLSAEENPDSDEDFLLVTEFFILVNDGDKTCVGANGAVLAFTLPEEAADHQFAYESDYEILDDNRVAYLIPFPPEERQVYYSYTLPVTSFDDLNIPLHIGYPTDALELRISVEDIEVATTHLAPTDPLVTDTGERIIRFLGEDLQRDTAINIYISESSGGWGTTLVILCAFAGVVVAGITVYSVRRIVKRKSE